MVCQLTAAGVADFTAACANERIFGSRILTALRTYGLEDARNRVYLYSRRGAAEAALLLADGVLSVSAADGIDPAPIADLVRMERVREVDADRALCLALQRMLGGELDSSYFMVYQGQEISGTFPRIVPGRLETVFDILLYSHPYYREHLRFEPWAADLTSRLERGFSELYQLEWEGQAVGTGCIASEDAECGVVGGVAVVPEFRHRGLGREISRFLSQRILQKGKTPRLMAGYDEVAALYRQVGFAPCGRWGELYL